MGGMALSNCTRRYSKEEYDEIIPRIIEDIFLLFNVPVTDILAYAEKESFGDADVLILSDDLPSDWTKIVQTHFNLSDAEIKRNSNVVSFKYEELQVDLIATPKEEFFSSYVYFSFNDLHNLIGRIGHKIGLKIAHDGLWLVVRPRDNANHIIGNVLITRDILQSYDILGLNPERWLQGFDTLDEIFEFVTTSKYFNPDIYLLDNRNATSRVRDKKRKTYTKFLEYCNSHKDELRHYQFPSNDERGGYGLREPFYTDVILKKWPEVENEVNNLIYDFELNERFKSIFNGEVVGSLTGLTGKDLGHFMSKCKDMIADKEYIIQHPEEIVKIIAQVKETFK